MQNGPGKSATALLAPQARSRHQVALQPLPAGLAAASASPEDASAPPPIYRHPFVIAIAFGVAALTLLLFGIGTPATMFYDEGYFVPEAKVFIQGPSPPAPHQEKPPLGKLLLSIGMRAAGDNALGWRVASAVCGALAVVAIFLWTYLLLQDAGLASFAAGLTLFNNFWFVMSRIGMMDAFLMLFLTWSLVVFTASLVLDVRVGLRRFLFCSSGVLIGLAGACKWNAIDTAGRLFSRHICAVVEGTPPDCRGKLLPFRLRRED